MLRYCMEEHYIHACPKCGSVNLKNFYLMSPAEITRPGAKKLKERFAVHPAGSIVLGWQPQNPDVYICIGCDYNGICPEVAISGIKSFRKNLKKN